MRGRKSLTLRGFAVVLVALGTMSFGASAVSAQAPACVNEPGLAFFDTNDDGVLSVAELEAVAASFPDDAELQALVAEAAADTNFAGIQYDGNCDGAGTTPTPGTGNTPTPGTGTTPTPGTGTTPPPADGGDDDDNGGVDQLPDTGTGVSDGGNGATLLLVGAGSVLALVGAFALRTRTLA